MNYRWNPNQQQFVTINNIPYSANNKPVVLKMVVKDSRSNSHYGCNVEVTRERNRLPNVERMVTPVLDYNVLL